MDPQRDAVEGSPSRPATVLVLAGGEATHPDVVLPTADLVVAADSGAEVARRLGLRVDVLVGDLDSVGAETLAALREGGAEVVRHHRDKDATDLELALDLATAGDPDHLVLVGGHGGRLDHALATPGALATVARPGRRVEAWLGRASVQATRDVVRVDGRPGELVSLLPWAGAARGVTTEGLRWALDDFTLDPGSTRGVSNEVARAPARVALSEGTLLVVRPHALDPAADVRPPVPDRPAPGARS
ncbi:thiamine diphosphokinase [Iamia majanohamensis]|uniref:Thiamine diphosphokinase n=1 Tax=Iamia majanohamensis TaxID=467976 RepID=A0AAF0BUP6_9ACTN|nr:thiamine diphosphokinase [Iamia majanohamensis]WCO65634.1 thiamine diphosphokinase [Iamia majanohamensis]